MPTTDRHTQPTRATHDGERGGDGSVAAAGREGLGGGGGGSCGAGGCDGLAEGSG